jgi:hypothetical protein
MSARQTAAVRTRSSLGALAMTGLAVATLVGSLLPWATVDRSGGFRSVAGPSGWVAVIAAAAAAVLVGAVLDLRTTSSGITHLHALQAFGAMVCAVVVWAEGNAFINSLGHRYVSVDSGSGLITATVGATAMVSLAIVRWVSDAPRHDA